MITPTSKLSDAQLVILSAAAARHDSMILPLPKTLRVRGKSASNLLECLLQRGLADEIPTLDDLQSWRTDEDGQRYALRINRSGLAAIGVEDSSVTPAETNSSADAGGIKQAAGRPGGKLGQVLTAMEADAGASIDDMIKLTGWQPHTVRAALTRLRQRGLAIRLMSDDPRKAYRLDNAAQA